MTTNEQEIYMNDWNDLFGAYFDKVNMDDSEKEEFVMDFYHMNKEGRSEMVDEMLEVIVGDGECMEFEMLIPSNEYLN